MTYDPKFKPILPSPTPVPKPSPAVRDAPPTPEEVAAALEALRPMLLGMRWDAQGGYSGRWEGKWMGLGHALGCATPEQLDALFAFAGVTPDEIEARGDCKDCANADNGRERGYARPCGDCLRPWHSHFVPAATVKRKKVA